MVQLDASANPFTPKPAQPPAKWAGWRRYKNMHWMRWHRLVESNNFNECWRLLTSDKPQQLLVEFEECVLRRGETPPN